MANEIEKKEEAKLATWDSELAKYATEAAEEESGGGQFISTQAGQLSIGDESVKGNALNVIVVDYIYENAYYKGKFDPKNKQPPVCFALGHDEATLAPHPDCAEPQSKLCATCPKNQFKSSENPDRPDGKACKNIRRLGLISADVKPEEVLGTEVLYLKTPVTSTKNWGTYVKLLNAMFKRPPFGVVTQISTKPDKKSQYKVTFTPVTLLGPEFMTPVLQKREMVAGSIEFPYSKPVPKDEGPKKY